MQNVVCSTFRQVSDPVNQFTVLATTEKSASFEPLFPDYEKQTSADFHEGIMFCTYNT